MSQAHPDFTAGSVPANSGSRPGAQPGDLLQDLIVYLADTLGVETNRDQIREAIESVSRECGLEGLELYRLAIQTGAEEAGLRVVFLRRRVRDAIRQATPEAVWVALSERNGRPEATSVLGGAGGGLRVSFWPDLHTPRTISANDLARQLGLNDDQGEHLWLIAEPAAPLAELHGRAGQQHDHPQAGGHDDHGHGADAHHGPSPFARLRGLMRVESRDLWVAVIYSAAIGMLSLGVPIATQSVVNTIAFGNAAQPLVVLTILVLVALGFATVLHSFRTWVIEILQRRVFVRVSSDVVHRLLRVRADAADQVYLPELTNRFFDIVTVQKSGAMLLVDGLSILMQTIVGMILLAVYHPWLAAFDILLLLAIAVVLFPMSGGAISTSIKESKAKYAIAAWIEEIARHITTFKSAAGSRYAFQRADDLVSEYLHFRSQHFRIWLRQVIGSFALQAVASATLLGVGGWLVIERQLTLGQLVAAEIVVALVVSGFSKFGKQLETFYDLVAAIDKLGYLTDLPLEQGGREPLKRRPEGMTVAFRDVRFAYADGPTILDHAGFDVAANTRVGIAGHSGFGKSSVVNLIYGLRRPVSGAVELDGYDLRSLRLSDVRSQIAVVRAAEIFEGTVAENVRLGDPRIATADVRSSLDRAGLLDEILTLPLGLETPLTAEGRPLSHGQTIRLMFARAIASRPRLLIVDEALDFIDDVRESEKMQRTLFDPRAPWTLLLVSANETLLDRCDAIYDLSSGGLRERGRATVSGGY